MKFISNEKEEFDQLQKNLENYRKANYVEEIIISEMKAEIEIKNLKMLEKYQLE